MYNEGEERKTRDRNILKFSEKDTIFNEHPVVMDYSLGNAIVLSKNYQSHFKALLGEIGSSSASDITHAMPPRVNLKQTWERQKTAYRNTFDF